MKKQRQFGKDLFVDHRENVSFSDSQPAIGTKSCADLFFDCEDYKNALCEYEKNLTSLDVVYKKVLCLINLIPENAEFYRLQAQKELHRLFFQIPLLDKDVAESYLREISKAIVDMTETAADKYNGGERTKERTQVLWEVLSQAEKIQSFILTDKFNRLVKRYDLKDFLIIYLKDYSSVLEELLTKRSYFTADDEIESANFICGKEVLFRKNKLNKRLKRLICVSKKPSVSTSKIKRSALSVFVLPFFPFVTLLFNIISFFNTRYVFSLVCNILALLISLPCAILSILVIKRNASALNEESVRKLYSALVAVSLSALSVVTAVVNLTLI